MSKFPKLTGYVLMQAIKESSTLRLGPKGEKPFPKIVFRFGSQGQGINQFLEYRRRVRVLIQEGFG